MSWGLWGIGVTAAVVPGSAIFRGIDLTHLPAHMIERLHRAIDGTPDPRLHQEVLHHLGDDHAGWWTDDPDNAKRYAGGYNDENGLRAVLGADWDGSGEDTDYIEDEIGDDDIPLGSAPQPHTVWVSRPGSDWVNISKGMPGPGERTAAEEYTTHVGREHPRFLYHNTGSGNRESILRDGLLPNYDQTAPVGEGAEHGGAYTTDTFRPDAGGDWWRIDTAELSDPPEPDWTTDPPEENENWYWLPGGVPPHALTLHHPRPAHRTAMADPAAAWDTDYVPYFPMSPSNYHDMSNISRHQSEGWNGDPRSYRSPYFYHATDAELQPGDALLPRSQTGAESKWGYGDTKGMETRNDFVWMWPSRAKAIAYAGSRGNFDNTPSYKYVYKVKPDDQPVPWNGSGKDGHVANSATVIGLVHRTAHRTAMPGEDYQGSHRPGGPDYGAPFYDLNQMWGEDIYEHPEWYDSMDYGIKNIQRQLNQARGNPDHPVVIYRALPPGITDINTGDWVTTSLPYARAHAMQSENPEEDFLIVRSTVPAKHVWTNNDLHEWGYHGPSLRGEIVHSNKPKKARTMTAAITVYTKPSCPQCDMTKKLLDRLGVEHDTVDVTADPEAHAYVTGLGYQQAPVVVVGDGEDHWGGFKVDRLKGLAG